jgi:hypothetical protein
MPTPHEANGETAAELLEDPAEGDSQGRGESNGSARRSPKRRPRPSAAGDKGKGRKLTLPDGVFERLMLHAIKKGMTVSATAADILDRNLPQHKIVTDG